MTDRTHDDEATRQNARIARHRSAVELVKQHGLLMSEACSLVDLGGPLCSKCGERVSGDVAAHVASHS